MESTPKSKSKGSMIISSTFTMSNEASDDDDDDDDDNSIVWLGRWTSVLTHRSAVLENIFLVTSIILCCRNHNGGAHSYQHPVRGGGQEKVEGGPDWRYPIEILYSVFVHGPVDLGGEPMWQVQCSVGRGSTAKGVRSRMDSSGRSIST